MYAAMSAFAISVLRACMMFAILQMAKIRKKVYDPLSAISLAAIIVLLLNPLVLFTASFQLSFLSVAGIIFCSRGQPAVRFTAQSSKKRCTNHDDYYLCAVVHLADIVVSLCGDIAYIRICKRGDYPFDRSHCYYGVFRNVFLFFAFYATVLCFSNCSGICFASGSGKICFSEICRIDAFGDAPFNGGCILYLFICLVRVFSFSKNCRKKNGCFVFGAMRLRVCFANGGGIEKCDGNLLRYLIQ